MEETAVCDCVVKTTLERFQRSVSALVHARQCSVLYFILLCSRNKTRDGNKGILVLAGMYHPETVNESGSAEGENSE